MLTRRTIMKTTLAAGAAALFAPAGLGHAAGGLAWKHFPAGQNGFFRAPVLVSGPSEAVLIDGGFTLSDGKAVADAIKATGKKLTTIYISQSDPDYYFSLGAIKAAFPEARVLATPATLAAINASVERSLPSGGRSSRRTARRCSPMWSSPKRSTARRSAWTARPSRSSAR